MKRVLFFFTLFFCAFLAYFLSSSNERHTIRQPLGLPAIPWPADNPYSVEKANLGRLLYFDKRLSFDGTISCASCHNRPCGFSDCKRIAIGIEHTQGTRHSPSIINAAYFNPLFWDGRANSLEEQSLGPLANVNEMTELKDPHAAHRYCVECVQKIKGYYPLFKQVFGHDQITIDEIAKAIATFERTILSGNSPYDRYIAGDSTALTQEQVQGMHLFKKVGCANCHAEPLFTDNRFHNIGVGMDEASPDLGRYNITHKDADWGAFRTPALREVSYSGPYMHNGSMETLEEVINYYNSGGVKNKNLHPLMRPLNLTDDEKKALISFLLSLNGEGWQTISEPKQLPE